MSWAYVANIQNAGVHWFFDQAIHAYAHELYLASALSYITGIEALLRQVAKPLEKNDSAITSEYLYSSTLSNSLLNQLYKRGVDVTCFRFPEESIDSFLAKLSEEDKSNKNNKKNKDNKDNKDNVRLVQLRHDINHGNIENFFKKTDGGEPTFAPEMMQGVCKILEPMALTFLNSLRGKE
ncbi:hypothetical protein [Thiomicrospira microaerophila]|uniref:hypothetical protein n=1 Tax=Thiomicrospira microaerophila TaxID=406020 RepID=UPI0012FE5122|nr:hypothetical protein [Thiomicrospira microaerophila]